MVPLIRKLRTIIAGCIAPKAEPTTALVLAPAEKWCRQGTGYSFLCCGTSYGPFDANEPHQREDRICRRCKKRFNLQRALDPAGTLSVAAFGDSLALLPSNALAKTAPSQQRQQWTGDEPVRAEWGGPRDAAAREREAAFENGDPGIMGPGF